MTFLLPVSRLTNRSRIAAAAALSPGARLSPISALPIRLDQVTAQVRASLGTGHQALAGGTTVLALLAAAASLSLGACTGAPTSATAEPGNSSASAALPASAASDPERKRIPTPVPRAASAAR